MAGDDQYTVQKFYFVNDGAFICYPKAFNNKHPWDGRNEPGYKWEMQQYDSKTVDLISDAGFSAGDTGVIAGIDVVAGDDASASQTFTVAENGSIANFEASGSTLDNSLTYEGTTNAAKNS